VNGYAVGLIGVTAGPTNESQSLRVFASSSNTALIPDPTIVYTSPGSSGSLEIHPAPNGNGSTTITVGIQDDGGTANGGNDSSFKTVTITVLPVNDAPVLNSVGTLSGAVEDTAFTVSYDSLRAVTDGSDVDGDTLVFQVSTLNNGTLTRSGSVVLPDSTLAPGESFVWTPPADENGLINAFSVRFSDGQASSAGSFPVWVNIVPVNDPPTITPMPDVRTVENRPLILPFTIADPETPAELLSLVFGSSNTGLVRNENLLRGGLTGATSLAVIPQANRFGSTTLTVTVIDGQGASAAQSFVVEVESVESLPILDRSGVLRGALEDQAFEIRFETLLAALNAFDPDGDEVRFRVESLGAGNLTWDGTRIVVEGSTLAAGQRVIWTPSENVNGLLDAFVVRAWDGKGLSTVRGQVQVEVAPVNDAPRLSEMGLLRGATNGVPTLIHYVTLLNASNAMDSDGDSIAFRIENVYAGILEKDGNPVDPGVTVLHANEHLVWTPDRSGLVKPFSVVAVDDSGGSSSAVDVPFFVIIPIRNQSGKLVADDGQTGDLYGYSVSVWGDAAVVGAFLSDPSGSQDSGAAYVHRRVDGVWNQEAKLVATDGLPDDRFGISAAISGDTVVIGANHASASGKQLSGLAYVFTRTGTNWVQQARLEASDSGEFDRFGTSVSVFGDLIVVGAPQATSGLKVQTGAAYVFQRNGAAWLEIAKLTAGDTAVDDWFGVTVANTGSTIVVGAFLSDQDQRIDSGAAYVFELQQGQWRETATLKSPSLASDDRFGSSVAISGESIVVGANRVDVPGRGTDAGAAYVFTRSNQGWTEQARLEASDGAAEDWFGTSVGISEETVVIGVNQGDFLVKRNLGVAYVYIRKGSEWLEQVKLVADDAVGGDRLGTSIAVHGDTALAGSLLAAHSEKRDVGAGYVFVVPGKSFSGTDAPTTPTDPAGIANASSVVATNEPAVPETPVGLRNSSAQIVSVAVLGDGSHRLLIEGAAGREVEIQTSSDMIHWDSVHRILLTSEPNYFLDVQKWHLPVFYRVVPSRTISAEIQSDR
jgi:hypothetical protein